MIYTYVLIIEKLNKITVKDNFSIPRIKNEIDFLDKNVFIKLDLKNTFHHIRIMYL